MHILGIGVATLDIVSEVASYPAENTELRASAQRVARGGNATNTLVMLSQLGHRCRWGGVMAEGYGSRVIREDLAAYLIGAEGAVVRPGAVPTSCITLSRSTGTRSIVHYRNLPEYTDADFAAVDLSRCDWVHFEGRNVSELASMLQRARRAGVPCSLEVEKPREGIEALFPQAELLLFSRDYALSRGFADAAAFLGALRGREPIGAIRTCTWGSAGAWGLDRAGLLHYAPALPVAVVDSLGAGDVFNAGMIHGTISGLSVPQSLRLACDLAGRKCAVHGFRLGSADG
jgi:ketohexokinase